MLLCIDIGNTNIKLGLFQGDEIAYSWRISTNRASLADDYASSILNLFEAAQIEINEIHGCAISSVVPGLTREFVDFSTRYLHQTPVQAGGNVQINLPVKTDSPGEVGADLLMNALAARQMYGTPVIIVGLGTATTFTAVSADGGIEGVAIAPGILTSANSLSTSTSTLPRIALERPKSVLGKNTITSLQAGLVFGFSSLVEGLVLRMQAELGSAAPVVATGGLAEVIKGESKVIDHIEPNLALIGLKIMYDLNRPG
jgi:type III pantothenate kinase